VQCFMRVPTHIFYQVLSNRDIWFCIIPLLCWRWLLFLFCNGFFRLYGTFQQNVVSVSSWLGIDMAALQKNIHIYTYIYIFFLKWLTLWNITLRDQKIFSSLTELQEIVSLITADIIINRSLISKYTCDYTLSIIFT